ncbi:MAG: hypothetical protein ACW964_14250 [Candidatus Hodarchaeales archaeon]
MPEPYFFKLEINLLGFFTPDFHPFLIILRFVAFFCLIALFIVLFRNSTNIPSFIISWENLKIFFISLIVAFLSLNLVIVHEIISVFTPVEDFISDLAYFSISIILSICVVMLYFNSSKTHYLNVFWGMDPELAIKNGYIGYSLFSMTLHGPEPLVVSDKFKEFSKISETALLGLSVNSIITSGSFRGDASKSIGELISLVPVPEFPQLTALTFSFTTINEELAKQDPRAKKGVATIFAIIFPSDLTIALQQLSSAMPIVTAIVNKHKNITELMSTELLEQMAVSVLKKLLY